MSIAVAKGLYGIGAKGPQDRRRRQMEDEQFERQGERHDLSMEQGQLGIQSTKQDMEHRAEDAERAETQFEWDEEDRAEQQLARRTQEDIMNAMLKFEVEGNLQPLISTYSDSIQSVSGWSETQTPEGKPAVTLQFEDGTTRTTPIHSYVDKQGNEHIGVTDLALTLAKGDPTAIVELRRQMRQGHQEAQQAEVEHDREMQQRLASRVPGERVQADEEGRLSVAPGRGSGSAGTIFEIGKLNVKDIDPAVVAKAQRHLEETGDYPAAVAMLSEGVQTREDKAFLERLASIPDMVRDMLPTEGLRNPIDQFVRRYPNEAEKYGVSEEDTYGSAFRKIEEGLAQEMGGGESRPRLGIGGDRGGPQPDEGGEQPDVYTPSEGDPGYSRENPIFIEALEGRGTPAPGTFILKDGRVYEYRPKGQR